jgi:hypothetical protein
VLDQSDSSHYIGYPKCMRKDGSSEMPGNDSFRRTRSEAVSDPSEKAPKIAPGKQLQLARPSVASFRPEPKTGEQASDRAASEGMEDWVMDDGMTLALGLNPDGLVCDAAPGELNSTASKQVSQTPEDMLRPVPGINRTGFIDHSDGAHLRVAPAEAGGDLTQSQPLRPATRVFVSGRHPQTAEWWYVTAFTAQGMARGYIQDFRVNTELPEPSAKLYQIVSGDTAERLAVQEYSSAVRDGHDLRYYENVLLKVNRDLGRAGIVGSYQDPGPLGGGANNIQLVTGHRIWLVSPAYARSLEGTVPDGSLTNGTYAKAKRFAGHIEDILRSVTESPDHLGSVAGEYAQAIRDHLPEIIGIVAGFLMAEALSALLAATPTGVGQIAAVVVQLGLAAFGATGVAAAGIEAIEHAGRWLRLAWTAQGKDLLISAASQEFVKMLIGIAMAALGVMGVKANYGNATKLAATIPSSGVPALAIAGGGQMGSEAAVAASLPRPYGPFATGTGMMSEQHGGGSGPTTNAGNAQGLIGTDFEVWLQTKLKATRGNFKVGGREFDGAVGSRWLEAKSGGYWTKHAQPGPGFEKFKSDVGSKLRIAKENGATLEIHSNTPIPQHVQDWLTSKGVSFFEH